MTRHIPTYKGLKAHHVVRINFVCTKTAPSDAVSLKRLPHLRWNARVGGLFDAMTRFVAASAPGFSTFLTGLRTESPGQIGRLGPIFNYYNPSVQRREGSSPNHTSRTYSAGRDSPISPSPHHPERVFPSRSCRFLGRT